MVPTRPPVDAPCSGVVLAAGRSTRMGREKALLEIDGIPLWRRQRDVLAGAGVAEIFLSARPDQVWTRAADGFTALLHDAISTGGPIVGIAAAIERATCAHVAVLAIDLPAMTSGWFATLRVECAPGFGVVGRKGDFFEPLAAIYPREMMGLAWDALVRGEYSLQRLIGSAVANGMMRVREIPVEDLALFRNWNEPA